ncbi:hypothetical protein JHK87_001545 [Glycine soja]|nr:hypothetical protein JHK87_001545 [Glycine soja]
MITFCMGLCYFDIVIYRDLQISLMNLCEFSQFYSRDLFIVWFRPRVLSSSISRIIMYDFSGSGDYFFVIFTMYYLVRVIYV